MVNSMNPMHELAGDFLLDGQERIAHVAELVDQVEIYKLVGAHTTLEGAAIVV